MSNVEEKISNFKCRCSSIHVILASSASNPVLTDLQAKKLDEFEKKDKLTEKQQLEMAELLVKKDNGTKVILSDGYISYLMEEYAWITEKMVKITKMLMDIPQMQKGIIVEAESLTLLSAVDGVLYSANENEKGERERIYNEFLSGEVDAYAGESIMTAKKIPDVKSTWDYPTFLCKIHEPLTNANDWQVKGYVDITGAEEGFIANCLVSTPFETMENIKYQLLRKMNVATEGSPKFKEAWKILERSMRFDHIPIHKRVFKKNVEPMTNEQRNRVYDKVKIGREWFMNFHETYQTLNF